MPTDVGQSIARFLRAAHPTNTAKGVSRDTGLSVSAVEKLLERQSAPNAINFVRLIEAYGPAFLAQIMPRQLGWLDEAARATQLAEAHAARDAADARIARLSR